MACPVCDHTMQNLGVKDQRIFWCPRCGTLKMENGDHVDIESPSWVRQIKLSSRFDVGRTNASQHTVVTCDFKVDQLGDQPITVELLRAHK